MLSLKIDVYLSCRTPLALGYPLGCCLYQYLPKKYYSKFLSLFSEEVSIKNLILKKIIF